MSFTAIHISITVQYIIYCWWILDNVTNHQSY